MFCHDDGMFQVSATFIFSRWQNVSGVRHAFESQTLLKRKVIIRGVPSYCAHCTSLSIVSFYILRLVTSLLALLLAGRGWTTV